MYCLYVVLMNLIIRIKTRLYLVGSNLTLYGKEFSVLFFLFPFLSLDNTVVVSLGSFKITLITAN